MNDTKQDEQGLVEPEIQDETQLITTDSIEDSENEKEKESIKSDALLFSEIEIAGIKIKPWSFGQLFKVSELLGKVLDNIESKGLSLDSITDDGLKASNILRLFTIASAELLEIISVTTGMPIEDIEKLDMLDGVSIFITIAKQNWNTVKNVLTPLLRSE